MGCDGGTIPRRDELVRTKKKQETKDKDSNLLFQWRCCSITQQPLQVPIVTCGLGRLYNKLTVIDMLLNKTPMPKEASHIKSLKDIKELNLTPNPTYVDCDSKDKSGTIGASPYLCPIIGLEMSGRFRFIALWSCGCVFSERALKQISDNVCLKCQSSFKNDDVVVLNGNDDDLVVLQERLTKRQQERKVKKEKKVKKEEETVTAPSTSKQESKPSGSKVSSTASTTTSNDRKRPAKFRELPSNSKKIRDDYSVAKDPEATDVFKSLFTTHQSEKQQNRAHWVTYNPFYN